MSYYGRKVGTVQPLLFGGYESGPRIPRESEIYFFGDSCFGRSSWRRKKEFGFFRSRFLPCVVKHGECSGTEKKGVEPETPVCRDLGRGPARPRKAGAKGPKVEAGVSSFFRSEAECDFSPFHTS